MGQTPVDLRIRDLQVQPCPGSPEGGERHPVGVDDVLGPVEPGVMAAIFAQRTGEGDAGRCIRVATSRADGRRDGTPPLRELRGQRGRERLASVGRRHVQVRRRAGSPLAVAELHPHPSLDHHRLGEHLEHDDRAQDQARSCHGDVLTPQEWQVRGPPPAPGYRAGGCSAEARGSRSRPRRRVGDGNRVPQQLAPLGVGDELCPPLRTHPGRRCRGAHPTWGAGVGGIWGHSSARCGVVAFTPPPSLGAAEERPRGLALEGKRVTGPRVKA